MLTQEVLKQLLEYDDRTGVFVRRSGRNEGCIAGGLKGRYVNILINRKMYQAHRLAWLYVTGEWPENHIDHINGDKHDNRFTNLRAATHSENKRNCSKSKANTSGFKGVDWARSESKWRARIKKQGKSHFIGYFDNPADAFAAYCKAAQELHGQFARTS